MKKISLIAILLIAVMMIVGCSHNAEVSKNADESENVSFSARDTENQGSKIVKEDESSTKISTIETTTAQSTTKPKKAEESTTAPTTFAKTDDKKSAGQTTTKKVTTTQKSITTQRQTTTRNQTATQKVTTTQKQTTTKRVTTTATRTTQSKKLTKSDIDWVQSQAHSYIKSKGMTVNSSVGSFSYRISSYNYTDRNKLLSEVKNTIDFEYSECINSGWKKVDMYVSVSSDGDGDYWLVVMYG